MHAIANCSRDLGQSSHLAAKAVALSPGCKTLCWKIQAVALASTYGYLCACVLGICIVFFQIQAFKYSASLQVQLNRSARGGGNC